MEEQYCGVPKSYLNFYAAFRNAEAEGEYTFPDGMCFPVDVLDQALDMMLEHAAGDMSKW